MTESPPSPSIEPRPRSPLHAGARLWTAMWGQASALLLETARRRIWIDFAILIAGCGILFGLVAVGREWTGVLRPAVQIDLSPARAAGVHVLLARPRPDRLRPLARFTLVYGYWAAKDRRAETLLVPLLDILQSIPVLGFMPGLVLALVGLFPRSNVGLELAAVVMIFTGQAWNMTFSFYHSLRSVPPELREVAHALPLRLVAAARAGSSCRSRTIGLVWNSMMSMAGGWFFLMINEAFVLGDHDFRLPGPRLVHERRRRAGRRPTRWSGRVVAMAVMIVALDQLLWRPVVVWAQKFRVEESGRRRRCRVVVPRPAAPLADLRRRAPAWLARRRRRRLRRGRRPARAPATAARRARHGLATGAAVGARCACSRCSVSGAVAAGPRC